MKHLLTKVYFSAVITHDGLVGHGSGVIWWGWHKYSNHWKVFRGGWLLSLLYWQISECVLCWRGESGCFVEGSYKRAFDPIVVSCEYLLAALYLRINLGSQIHRLCQVRLVKCEDAWFYSLNQNWLKINISNILYWSTKRFFNIMFFLKSNKPVHPAIEKAVQDKYRLIITVN